MYKITTKQEYWYCRERGLEPMRDRHFCMDIDLRRELQRELFGRGNKEQNDLKFYRYAWEIDKAKICEECCRPLYDYSSTYISHIISRGAGADTAFDLRNYNILCPEHHRQWETGDRKSMRIYRKNQKVIEELRKDYNDKIQ